MAEPIIIVKEGSLTVEVRKRPNGGSGNGTLVLKATIPGNLKFPPNSTAKVTKSGGSWKVTWKKEPQARRRSRRRY